MPLTHGDTFYDLVVVHVNETVCRGTGATAPNWADLALQPQAQAVPLCRRERHQPGGFSAVTKLLSERLHIYLYPKTS